MTQQFHFLDTYCEKICISIVGNLNKELILPLLFFFFHFAESVKDHHMTGSPFRQC